MNRFSKEKRQQLVLVILVTFVCLAGFYWVLIRSQQESLRKLDVRKQTARQKLQQVKQAIESADQIESQLCENQKRLDRSEEGMAAGDLYAWVITTVRTFKAPYKLDIPQFSQIEGPRDVSLLAGFPYKQATLNISGTTSFHEFGRFVSDFENQFPHVRLMNLTLEPVSTLASNEKEKLSFKVDIVALVKPGAS